MPDKDGNLTPKEIEAFQREQRLRMGARKKWEETLRQTGDDPVKAARIMDEQAKKADRQAKKADEKKARDAAKETKKRKK